MTASLRFLLAGLALLLAACGTPQPLAGGAGGLPPMIATATLATNACELQVAPTYTAAIHAVEVAAARTRAGTLPVVAAEQVGALGRGARADLDAACRGGALDAGRLARARAAVDRIKQLLGG